MFKGTSQESRTGAPAETFIGPSVKLEGNFSSEGDIVVEGILVGTLATRGDIRVGSQAVIEAQVHANNALIAGKVKGNLVITGSLKLTSTASISGDIKATSIAVEEGAVINGKISMGKDKERVMRAAQPEQVHERNKQMRDTKEIPADS